MKRTLIYMAVLAVLRGPLQRQTTYEFGRVPDDSATLISYRFAFAA